MDSPRPLMGEGEGERVIKKIKNFQFLFSPFSKGGTKGGFLSPYAYVISHVIVISQWNKIKNCKYPLSLTLSHGVERGFF